MARGVPGVVTPILAGQMGWPDGSGYRIHDWRDPAGFARALVRLHADEAEWTRVQRAGLDAVAREGDAQAYRATLRRLCEAPVFP